MITSLSNKQLKNVIQLTKKSKVRKEQELFIVEGIKMFLEAPKELIKQVFVSETFIKKDENEKILNGIRYEVVDDKIFQLISDTQTPQGILCVIKQLKYELDDILKQENPLLIILEDLQDPGNMGTIVRTGEGAGVDGIIMSQNTVDIYNPKTIRSTMGSIYRMPFIYVKDINSIIETLKIKKISTYAAHLKGEKFYNEFNYKKGSAFLIGNEGNGLSNTVSDASDYYLKIPMEGKVESLNAAVASSILMYEAHRQRG